MKPKHALPLAGILLTTSCSAIPGPTPLDGHASLSLTTRVRPAGYRAQAAVSPYGQSDIDHVRIQLFKLVSDTETPIPGVGGVPLMLELPQASLSAPITFANLDRDTTYRVRATAYADPGIGRQISLDASSSVDVKLTNNDRPTMASLPVQLTDQSFAGQASTSLTINPGQLDNPASMSIGLAPSDPN